MSAYCPYCMSPVSSGTVCPGCGADPASYHPASHHFPMGQLLHDRYLVGKVLGEGGFGITYSGLDTTLERRVAVKEYFPNMFVHRETSVSLDVTCYEGRKKTLYEKGRDQFLQEARVMARFDDCPGIVHVLDFFPAYNTAYIVMELLTGDTLRTLLTRQKRIPAKYLLEIMEPALRTMHAMHKAGIIHRDISPDNIILLNNGQVKLLDFGCARDIDKEHTMTVMLKHGYAPIEQYTGYNQGPWTDIYALCATFYHCLTGRTLPKALERMTDRDTLIPPNQLGADLTPDQEKAILRGLETEPKNRWQSIAGLYEALYGTAIKGFPEAVPPEETELIEDEINHPLHDKKQNMINECLDEKAENSGGDSGQSQQDKKTGGQPNGRRRMKKIIAAVALLSVVITVGIVLNRTNGAENPSEAGSAQAALDAIAEYNSGMSLFEEENYDEALSHFLTAAKAENIDAMEMIYRCWWKGASSIEQEDALKWIQKAAEHDNTYAMRIAAMYIYAANKEYDTAVDMLKKAAAAGDAVSMGELGDIYMYGNEYGSDLFEKWDGFQIDKQEAVNWYKKAAEAGNDSSMYELAACYVNGIVVEKNLETALQWYRKAADAGNTKAMEAYNNLTGSNVYDTASPVSENYKDGLAAYSSRNYQKAAELYEKAYQSDHDIKGLVGLYSLVDWFDTLAITGDADGVDWLMKTADAMAQTNYKDFGDTDMTAYSEKIQQIYYKAASYGNAEAASGMYHVALKFAVDSEFFQKWMKTAAECGSEEAKAFLN